MTRRAVAVTGAEGFVGKSLLLRLAETGLYDVRKITRHDDETRWHEAIDGAYALIHLSGVNRPPHPSGFKGNVDLAAAAGQALARCKSPPPRAILLSSSQAELDNPYGESKRQSEHTLSEACKRPGTALATIRAPNIFGKWARPNYNSAVATFCHNLARGLPIEVHDPDAAINLLYVDDLITVFLELLERPTPGDGMVAAEPVYGTTVGKLAKTLNGFAEDRANTLIAEVGTGLLRALYATFISYLPVERFAYPLVAHQDSRGTFSEMLRTRTSGQFSYFNAHPGVTRGGHYHHTKTEKFLVVNGRARFRFRHMLSGETTSLETSAQFPIVVETIPGWTHDVTNIGEDLLVCLLWANEIFDRERPDTIAEAVS